jgi:hypothetical protein
MADTFSAFLNLTRPEVGGSRDAWGDKWNDNATKLDNWAKATDALAKDALAKSGVQVRDAQNALVYSEQAVAGPLRASGKLTAAVGVTIPRDQRLTLGMGYVAENATYLDVVCGSGNSFRVVDTNYTYEMFRADPNGAYYRNQAIWHTGNLTPGNYHDRTQTAVQQLSGPFSINMVNPYFDLTYGNVLRSRQIVDANGNWILRDGDSGDNKLYVGREGTVWTKQLGDLNSRIEARASAFSADALAQANSYYEARAPYRTNVAAMQRTVGDLEIWKAYPNIRLHYPNVKIWDLHVRENGYLYFGQDGLTNFPVYMHSNGNLNATAWGSIWLTDYIENRGAAYRNDATANANAYYEARAPIRGNLGSEQSMAGALKVSMANPYFRWEYPGVSQFYFQLQGDRYLRGYTDGTLTFSLGPNGEFWSAQTGNVYDRIESRGSAYGQDAKNYTNSLAPIRANLGGRQDMVSALAVTEYLDIVRGGVMRARWSVDTGGTTILSNGDNGDIFFYVTSGGGVYTKQFGDLNNRIEDRARAWRDDAINNANAYYEARAPIRGNIAGTQSMAGDLWINKGYPEYKLTYPGVWDWGMLVRESARLAFRNFGDNADRVSFGPGGDIATMQFGDVNSRIEQRCSDFSNDRLGTATNRINNKSFRMAYAGDQMANANLGNWWEPYGGAVVTGMFGANDNTGFYASAGLRFRYAQMSDSNGNWYTCGYV